MRWGWFKRRDGRCSCGVNQIRVTVPRWRTRWMSTRGITTPPVIALRAMDPTVCCFATEPRFWAACPMGCRCQRGRSSCHAAGSEHSNDGRGLVHIEFRHGAQIRAAGWSCVTAFVAHLAADFNEMRQDQGGQLFLVRRDPARTLSQHTHDVLIIKLYRDDRTVWLIATAGPFKAAYIGKRSLLWQAVHTAAPQPNELAAPSNAPPTQMSVSVGRLSARYQN